MEPKEDSREDYKYCVRCGKRRRYNSFWRLLHNKCVKEFDEAEEGTEYMYDYKTGQKIKND
jgi:hypothetical protein